VLNRNPANYFAEVEQSAFSPSHMIPGIEPSLDKMLQARLFSYPDTHLHRLGPNYLQIPINCPYVSGIHNYQRDGLMCINGNAGSAPNYFPNSIEGAPKPATKHAQTKLVLNGFAAKHPQLHPNSDFEQPGLLYNKVMNDSEKTHLVNNLVGSLSCAKKHIQERTLSVFAKVDKKLAERIADGLRKAGSSL